MSYKVEVQSDITRLLKDAFLEDALNFSARQSVVSAGTTDIGAVNANDVLVTGTTTITSLGTIAAGAKRRLYFDDALTLTYNGTSLILQTAANITTAAGDSADALSLGSGNWLITSYSRADGSALVGSSVTLMQITDLLAGAALTGYLGLAPQWGMNHDGGVSTTLDLKTAESNFVSVNSATGDLESFGTSIDGDVYYLVGGTGSPDPFVIKTTGNISTPGGFDITVLDGDRFTVKGDPTGGGWTVYNYERANGSPLANASATITLTGDVTGSDNDGSIATTIADDAVTTVKILDANVTSAKLAANVVTDLLVGADIVGLNSIDVTTVTVTGTLTAPSNGFKIKDSGDDNSLTVNVNEDLTDDRTLNIVVGDADRTLTLAGNATLSGTNTGDQTITLTGDVTGSGAGSFAATIASNAVTTVKIADANVTAAKLASDSVTTVKILDANVTTAKIADANVTAVKLAADSVTTVKILDANVTAAKLADDSVTTVKILDANVTTAKILDANVTAAKLASDSVITVKILDANVTAAKLAADSVTTVKILDANVTAAKLAADSVTTVKILDANVTAAKLASDSVTTVKILDANVTSAKLGGDITTAGKALLTAADAAAQRTALGVDPKKVSVNKSADYTITETSEVLVIVDTSGGAVVITLPASPVVDQIVNVKKFTTDTNQLTIARNGKNIDGAASNIVTTSVAQPNWTLQYNATSGWILI